MSYVKHEYRENDILYASQLNEMDDQIAKNEVDIQDLIDAVKKEGGYARYGVTGIGQAASELTRIWDSVGMVAQVGTDGDVSGVINDFDAAKPFMRRKCVGEWNLVDGKAVFTVNAYLGDANYTEDGSMGDYVAVECPLCYYYFDGSKLGVSVHPYDGWRAFDIFASGHDQTKLLDKVYLPAYALAQDEQGKAVCLSGYLNCAGDYKSLMDAARTYKNGALGGLAYLEPAAVNFYEWALFTVEFATQNCQNVMQGCCNLRQNENDTLTFLDATHAVASGWFTERVVGEHICIMPTNMTYTSSAYKATHIIMALDRCDQSGTPDTSGEYTLLSLDDLDAGYWEYDYTGETAYKIAARPYPTGACNEVKTPSGSPVSNSDGMYPMRYRYRENVFGNQFRTAADLFGLRVEDEKTYKIEYYFATTPETLYPAKNIVNADLQTDAFEKLDIETPSSSYRNGYIKEREHSALYPDLWAPTNTGGSASTYTCDYASLASSPVVRSVRLGGYWATGAFAGFSYFNAFPAPSHSFAHSGGSLCFAQ